MKKEELINNINKLRKEKNAVIMAHFYQSDEIQEIADHIGDSLALAQLAAKTDADIIVICGVNFMGETAKLISPSKKVLLPDMNSGCSLAESCPTDKFRDFVEAHPDHKVISYVNTTAEVKALTDIVVTSSNAVKIVESYPKDQKIIFGPDRNLGDYINRLTGRKMLLWDGCCKVHNDFSAKKLEVLKEQNKDAEAICHPECKKEVTALCSYAGSTSGLIKYVQKSKSKKFIVGTENGVFFDMKRKCPDKIFIQAPSQDGSEHNGVCEDMRLVTLEKLYECLKNESNEIKIDDKIAEKAVLPIKAMLDLSAKLGL